MTVERRGETADGLEPQARKPRRAVRHRPRLAAGRSIAGAGDLRRQPRRRRGRPKTGHRPTRRRSRSATWFAIHPFRVDPEAARQYLADVRESLPLYAAEGLVHPGMILHIGNWALRHNVVLGPWMHVGSRIEHFAAAKIGDEALGQGAGHRQLPEEGPPLCRSRRAGGDANRTTPVARIAHISIYRPRQLAAA